MRFPLFSAALGVVKSAADSKVVTAAFCRLDLVWTLYLGPQGTAGERSTA